MAKPVVIWIRPKEEFSLDVYDVYRVEEGVLHDAAIVGKWGRQQVCGASSNPDHNEACSNCNGHGYFIWWIEENDGDYSDDTRRDIWGLDFDARTYRHYRSPQVEGRDEGGC